MPLQLHLAALGPRTLRLAGRIADGVALNFVGPAALPALLAEIDEGAAEAGRSRPVVTVWTHVTVSPDERDVRAARRWLAPYLSIPGYDRVLRLQGFGAQAERAQRERLRPAEAAELVDGELLAVVAGFGSAGDARHRIDALLAHGVEVALLAGAVRPGAATVRTLEALAPVTGDT
ncbi:MAG: LLM class flavin-dependent oxidoreductase [Acidimicrobiales bacterium]